MSKLRFVVAGVMAIAMPAVAGGQEVGRNLEVWTWQGRVDAGRSFRLESVNGPVTVEASPDNMVHVRAQKIVRRGSISDVAFQVVQSGGDVTVCGLWRRSTCEEDGIKSQREDHDNDRRDVQVRFTVSIPRGVKLEAGTVNGAMSVRDVSSDVRASTVNGRVEVRNVGGEVRATTVNGAVNVSTRSGPVTARTVNGNIDVTMSAIQNAGDMEFETVNGNVRVEAPSSINANVSLETMHGTLMSDYPVQIQGRFGPRRASGTIGRGGQRLKMETLNGNIELRKGR